MAVNFGYRKDRKKMCSILLLVTAAFGATFVGMQAFEWTKLIVEGGSVPGAIPWARPSLARAFS